MFFWQTSESLTMFVSIFANQYFFSPAFVPVFVHLGKLIIEVKIATIIKTIYTFFYLFLLTSMCKNVNQGHFYARQNFIESCYCDKKSVTLGGGGGMQGSAVYGFISKHQI